MRYGVSVSTLYDWMAKGLFPRPVQLGPRAVGWRIADLERWEAERLEATDLQTEAPTS